MRKKTINQIEETQNKDIFNQSWTHYLMMGLIVIVISVLFYKIAFLNYAPKAHDTFQWRNSAQQIIVFNKENDEQALWTDNMFSGMPSYLISLPAKYPFLHNLLSAVDSFVSWRIIYLIFGGIGVYLLMIHLKFTPLVALFSALAFALSTHFIGIIEIGHNTKFKAVMYFPWIFLMLDDLRENKRIMSLGLLSLFLIDQLRINHFQISYYMYIVILIYWITFLFDSIKNKNIKEYMLFTGLLAFAFLISVIAVANPYLSVYEYSHHTIRGGATGLSTDYATGWSLGVPEVLNFLVPHFYGGISPYYWGTMPFTQTFIYMGIIVFYLALMASIFYFKKPLIRVLVISSIVAILISFGKNFPLLSNFLLSYLPGFNKFRVPAMTLVIVQFTIVILAAYGLKLFMDKKHENSLAFKKITLFSLLGSVFVFLLFAFGESLFAGLSFTKVEELSRYQPAQLQQLRAMRLELLLKSGLTSFGILTSGIFVLWLFLKNFLNKNVILLLLIGLTVTDLQLVNKNHFKDEIMVKENKILNEFINTQVDEFLLNDDSLFRIYPFHDFGNARWSYHHQSIGGYHGAKIDRYQDIIEKSLYFEFISGIPINFNILNMLNVKYVIFNKVSIPIDNLQMVYQDRSTQNNVYENLNVLPRAWFVKNHEIIKDRNRMFLRLNNPQFNPAETVLLENEIADFSYPENYNIELIHRDIHKTKWQVSNDKTTFMVISEIYYPEGWNIYINGEKTKIHPANYILRGIIVPPGEHLIEMIFEPQSYRISLILSFIGLSSAIILSLVGAIFYFKLNYRGEIKYLIKR